VLQRIEHLFPGLPSTWTASTPLPGGDIPNADFDLYLEGLNRLYAWLPEPMLRALARRHGTLAGDVIGDARRLEDMGAIFGTTLSAREVRYFADYEWASTPDDVLWRRTKVGLHLASAQGYEAARASIEGLIR
jgi:glycerol-3-phosphate dehydrogenase